MRRRNAAFTLVELLVVIGILALLVSMLLPSLSKAREQAKNVQCASNMKQVAIMLAVYANENNGWIFPVGRWMPNATPPRYDKFDAGRPKEERWPMYVWSPPTWNPPELTCPLDENAVNEHTYVLNMHLVKSPQEAMRFHTKPPAGKTDDTIIILGEKFESIPDYCMDPQDYPRVVDLYKHGLLRGSNYLFKDLHVDHLSGKDVPGLIDPWEVAPTTQPTTP